MDVQRLMRMGKQFLFVAAVFLGMLISQPVLVQAQGDDPLGFGYGAETGLSDEDPRSLAGNIIRVALALLGIIAVVFIVYAGFLWMTSGGNNEQITKARRTIMYAAIGLLIILSAFAITEFVLQNLSEATTAEPYFRRFRG